MENFELHKITEQEIDRMRFNHAYTSKCLDFSKDFQIDELSCWKSIAYEFYLQWDELMEEKILKRINENNR